MADTHKKKWARKLDLCSSHKSDYWCGLTGWMIEVTIMMLMAVPFSSFVANTFLHLGFLSLFSFVSLFFCWSLLLSSFIIYWFQISTANGSFRMSCMREKKKHNTKKPITSDKKAYIKIIWFDTMRGVIKMDAYEAHFQLWCACVYIYFKLSS